MYTNWRHPSNIDDPNASVFRGRPVKDTPDNTTFNLIAGWVTDCDESHTCGGGPKPLPVRLIDVGGPESDDLARLVDIDQGMEGRYAALTYGWDLDSFGSPPTPSAPMQGGNLDAKQMPKIFQDAIQVTRRLRVRYLWIDQLCIPPDGPGDWERDSEAFVSIYANSYITVSATGAKHGDDGLLLHRQTRAHVRVAHARGGTQGTLLMYALPLDREFIRDYYAKMKSEPLEDSVWAFQERVFSRRILHFASDQVYFECTAGLVSEDGLSHKHRYHSIEPPLEDPKSDLNKKEEAKPHGGLDFDGARGRIRWHNLLSEYTRLRPANPADKLPAISNIARKYATLLCDEYIAGMWRRLLFECLVWQSMECREPEGGYRAPSWSWAAVDGPALAGLPSAWDPVAVVLESFVELVDNAKPFGAVKNSWLRMEAPLVPLRLSETKTGRTGYMCLRTQKGSGGGSVARFDTIDGHLHKSGDVVREMTLFALVVLVVHWGECNEGSCASDDVYQCIIATPVDGDMERMKRVGFLLMFPSEFGPDEIASSRRVFTFV